MKCPKCGFNSFEFLENCKKCGVSLASFKKTLGISPLVYSSAHPRMETPQSPPEFAPPEEASLPAAPIVQPDEGSEETFTWDIPAPIETVQKTETAFSGFDLDFMKDAEEPVEPRADFSFDEEPVTESAEVPKDEASTSFEEFSFYENTLDLVDAPSPADDAESASGNDPFGETGVIGEILPENLQTSGPEPDLSDLADDSSLETLRYENEFTFEHLSGETGSEKNNDKETNEDSLDLSDFEKDFESIFHTDDSADKAKAEG